jgi:hypothetical protein
MCEKASKLSPKTFVTHCVYLYCGSDTYGGNDFILQVREVRLKLTFIELGSIFKLLHGYQNTTVSSKECLLTDVPSLFLNERDVPLKDSNTVKLNHARYRL